MSDLAATIDDDELPRDVLSPLEEEKESAERSVADWFMLGVNAYIHEAYDEAISNFDRVIELDAENARAYANRGDVYADLGGYQEAFNDYAMAIYLGSEPAKAMQQELRAELLSKRIITEQEAEILCPILSLKGQ